MIATSFRPTTARTTATADPQATDRISARTRRFALLGSFLILALAAFALASQAASAAPLFDAKSDFTTGTTPASVTTEDFNADGRPDLAVANQKLQHRLGPARKRQRQLRGKDRLPHRHRPRLSHHRRLQQRRPPRPGGRPTKAPTPSRSCSETAPAASQQRPTSPPAQTPSQSPQKTSTATAAPTWRSPTSAPTPSRSCSETAAAASRQRPTSPPAQTPSQSPQKTSTATARPDLAVANHSSNTVSVLLGDGSGSFAAKTDFTTGTSPRLSHHRRLQQRRHAPTWRSPTSTPDTVSVLLGDRHRQLRGKDRLHHRHKPPPQSPQKTSTATARPDLAVANSGSATVSILLGNGTGSFGAKTDFTTGASPRISHHR